MRERVCVREKGRESVYVYEREREERRYNELGRGKRERKREIGRE